MVSSKPVNSGKPWTYEEMLLIAGYVPTKHNIKFLADQMGRSYHAVQYMFCKIYEKSSSLKKDIETKESKSMQYTNALKVRQALKLEIGI